MTENDDDDPDYIVKFKAASVNDFSECVADVNSIETLQIAAALDSHYKNSKCLSDNSKE